MATARWGATFISRGSYVQTALEFDPPLAKEMEGMTERMANGVRAQEAARRYTTWASGREVMRTLHLMLEHAGRWGPEAVLWLIDYRVRATLQCIADGVPGTGGSWRSEAAISGRWQLDDGPLEDVEGWWDLRGVNVNDSQEIVGLRVICKDISALGSGF